MGGPNVTDARSGSDSHQATVMRSVRTAKITWRKGLASTGDRPRHGPLVEAALTKDRDHHRCVELFTGIHLAQREMTIPSPVVAEVGYLLATKASLI